MTDNTQYTDIDRGNNDVTPEGVLAGQSEVLLDDSQRATGWHEDANQEWEEREARNELKHVAGLGCRTSPKSNTARCVWNVWCSSASGHPPSPRKPRPRNR